MTKAPKFASSLAFAIPIVAVAAWASGTWLDLSVNPTGPGESTHWSDALWPASFLGFPIVGAIISSRLVRNAIGWALCGIGVSISVSTFATEYAQFALVSRPGAAPLGNFSAWLATWFHFIAVGCLIALVIVFPRGHPRNGLWWAAFGFMGVATVASTILYAIRPGRIDGLREVSNPGGVESVKAFADAVIPYLGLGLALIFVAAVADKVWVFVKSRGIERQQIKWFALSALMFPILFALTLVFEESIGQGNQGEFDPVVLVFFFGFNGMAAGIGFAVFKHRLYEIDLVINRALVYGGLTAILASAYVGLVFAFNALLAPVTAESDLAVAASTLAVAALFGPLRRRVQSFIDRRFYRHKFDAQRTVEEFNTRLRDEVELAAVTSGLVGVVSDTMQPTHISLWMRHGTGVAR